MAQHRHPLLPRQQMLPTRLASTPSKSASDIFHHRMRDKHPLCLGIENKGVQLLLPSSMGLSKSAHDFNFHSFGDKLSVPRPLQRCACRLSFFSTLDIEPIATVWNVHRDNDNQLIVRAKSSVLLHISPSADQP